MGDIYTNNLAWNFPTLEEGHPPQLGYLLTNWLGFDFLC